jgi:hypothetical protein
MIDLSQKFAAALDDYDKDASYSHSDSWFVWKSLSGATPDSTLPEVRRSLLSWSKSPINKKLSRVAHVVFRYRLLDILANVLGLPSHPDLGTIPMVRPPPLTGKLQEVIVKLQSIDYSFS